MSYTRSDNHKHAHPKPEAEHYRFFDSVSGAYRDYADQAEVLATITSVSDRKNKTVRIAAKDYLIDNDGTTFILKSDGSAGTGGDVTSGKIQWLATGGETQKAVANTGATILTMMQGGGLTWFEHTGALPVPARHYKYAGDDVIYFGSPLYGDTEYVFIFLKQ